MTRKAKVLGPVGTSHDTLLLKSGRSLLGYDLRPFKDKGGQ